MPSPLEHPRCSRRTILQAGSIGLLGLGTGTIDRLRAATVPERNATTVRAADSEPATTSTAQRVIFIFLSGGLAQHESFDPKAQAPVEVRGEFRPIATRTPGVHICEHLPRLAARSEHWALVRSLTHPFNDHSQGHLVMLSGRSVLPTGFNPNQPQPNDHPSLAAIAGATVPARNNLPPAIVLPEKLIHRTGRVIPGQFAGLLGAQRDPFVLDCCPYNPSSYGAWPEYGFDHQTGARNPAGYAFRVPSLTLPDGFSGPRLSDRVELLSHVERQQHELEQLAEVEAFDRFQARAVSMLADPKIAEVFDVTHADDRTLDRYGRHTFGWSLLMARRLVEYGVSLVQVNLGNDETWDTHGNAFPHLKNYLLPPLDQSLSALLDDLVDRNLLSSTLVVMAGEFGRAPKITHLPQHYALPGRDHWGEAQTVWLAGGGIRGGAVLGATDKLGGTPLDAPQTPENFAATIYRALGLPRQAVFRDLLDRPLPVYHGEPFSL